MEKTPLTNWFGWAEVVGTARFIVNSTAPGDCCFMSEDSIANYDRKLYAHREVVEPTETTVS